MRRSRLKPGARSDDVRCMEDTPVGWGWGWWSGTKWLRALGTRIRQVAYKVLAHRDPADNLMIAEDVLAKQLRRFGPDGGPTANARAEVAKRLEILGRFVEARVLREEVVAANRRHRGNDDLYTLAAEEWLAFDLVQCGMRDEASELYSHVYEVRLRDIGPDDARTAHARANLAAMGASTDDSEG
jgi:hypothetical protein